MDEWVGPSHFHRSGAWAFYLFMNILSIYFNSCLMISVYRLRDKKTSTDVLIAGLSSGIVCAAFGCGPQCFFNLVLQSFAFGQTACFVEAYMHIVGMIIQFLSVSAIAYRTFVGVVKLQPFEAITAFYINAGVWVIAFTGTIIFGHYSAIYLVASGTFCFYSWTSLALIAWAWPVAGIAAILMGYWYYRTFQVVARVRRGAKDFLLEGSKRNADLLMKLSTLVLFFVFGYSGIVAQSLYEVFVGRAKIWGDVIAACIVLIYWVCAPFAYALANHRLGLWSVLKGSPESRSKIDQSPNVSNPRPNGTTEMSSDPLKAGSGGSQLSKSKGVTRIEGSPDENNEVFFSFEPLPTSSNSPIYTPHATVINTPSQCEERGSGDDSIDSRGGNPTGLFFSSLLATSSSPDVPDRPSVESTPIPSSADTSPRPLSESQSLSSGGSSTHHQTPPTAASLSLNYHKFTEDKSETTTARSNAPLLIPTSVSLSSYPELSSTPSHGSVASPTSGGGGSHEFHMPHSSMEDDPANGEPETPDFSPRQIFNPFTITNIQTNTPTPPIRSLSAPHSPSHINLPSPSALASQHSP